MTPDRLNEIEALANAATAGPWRSTWGETEGDVGYRDDTATVRSESPAFASATDRIVTGALWVDGILGMLPEGRYPACREPDAAFIASARTAVPELIAEVRAKDAEIEQLQASLGAAIEALRG